MSYDYGNVPDYTYGNPLVDELAGAPPPKAKVLVSALKAKPRVQSSSIAPTTAIESIQPKQPIDPLQARIDALGKQREGLLKEQDTAYETPDYAGYGDYAQQRRDTGSRALVMALAAQQAGMEPFQAHYLRQAAEARAPMKVTGGTITDQGFVEDVGHTQELKARRIDARLKQLDVMESQAFTLQQQQAIARERMQLQKEMQESQLALRRDMAAIAAGNRQNATSLQQDRIGGQVYDDYMKASKDDISMKQSYDNLKATASKAATGGSDLSFIFQYMKMLDPASVVREGEFANAQNSAGIPDKIRNLYNRAISGVRLTPNQRQEFLDVAGRLSGEADRRLGERRSFFEARLKQQGLNPAVYLPGYEAGSQGAPEGAVRVAGARPAAAPEQAPDQFPAGAVRVKR